MKKVLVIVLGMLLLVGCGKEWESKKVLNKTENIESVGRSVSDPRWEYSYMCGIGVDGKFDCSMKYGYNINATKTVYEDEMVYRVEFYVIYEDGTEETITSKVSEEEYNSYKIGKTIYKGER